MLQFDDMREGNEVEFKVRPACGPFPPFQMKVR